MEDLNYFLKCTVVDQLSNSTQFSANVSASVLTEVTKTTGYGTFTGIALAILASGIFNTQFRAKLSDPCLKIKRDSALNAQNLQRALVLSVLLLLLPILTVFLLFAYIYKLLCSIVIKKRDKSFAGFLDSFDVFWSLEDDTAKSVINVLGIIESNSSASLANDVKDKLQNIFPNEATDKIFFRRKQGYGFYYWRRNESFDIDQYVELVEISDKSSELSKDDLENVMTEIASESLPYNNEGLFKILITKHRVSKHDDTKGQYGIIFRIHHSVGDGVALIEFLCNTLADDKNACPINMFSVPKLSSTLYPEAPNNFLEVLQKFWEMPICLVDGVLRKPDDNSLHGPKLLNKLIFKWTEPTENLLKMVKEIKRSVAKTKFTDVLAAALSSGLHNFFAQTKAHIPKDVAVVLPIRFSKSTTADSDLKLENDFSVTILDLPVKEHRLETVQARCNVLRKSADPLTNYYLLKILNSVLPKQVLQPLLNSSQATMVFSNLPGPGRLSICGGDLSNLIFFVPQRGSTGIGVTALCYDGVLRFGAVADAALVSEPADLRLILDGMVAEIGRLHQKYVQ